jgi:hypothetical protein
MSALLRRCWGDDRAAVISVELILVIGVLVFGMIPGLVALRNGMNAALVSVANLFLALSPTFSFSNTANGVVIVIGATGTSASFLTASQLAPIVLPDTIIVPPAP